MKAFLTPRWLLTLAFLGIIGIVPLIQVGVDADRGDPPQFLDVFKKEPTAANLRAFERSLQQVSWLAAWLRPWAQYVQFFWLKDGGDKALVGRDGWYFYKPGLQLLTERPGARRGNTTAAQAIAAVVDFRDQLSKAASGCWLCRSRTRRACIRRS
jgi:hypothetical protein